jgi:hypothetical protein
MVIVRRDSKPALWAESEAEQIMKKTIIIAAVAAGLGFFNAPTFAQNYVVNGQPATAAQVQFLVSNGFQPGAWVVNGFGIAPADSGSAIVRATAAQNTGKTCWYVLDELLCD